MRVAQISFFRDPSRTPADILRDWWVLVDCAEMVAQADVSVTVIQACRAPEVVTRNGVTYHFIGPERGAAGMARSQAFAALIRDLKPDVIHVNGLGFPADTTALAKLVPGTPIVIQDHADRPPRPWRRPALRRALSLAAGISFCALDQARPFAAAGLLDPGTALFEIPECSSRFTPGDREEARLATGIHGDPAVLWVGHLDTNKDPLTVLAGISAAMRHRPGLRLWCCHGSAALLPEVTRRIESDHSLRGKVHLLGKVPHRSIEQLMRAADIFVLGSHREGSGCSLIEALACGLPPVVTDIPSFRMLTGAGRVGALWPCGDPGRLTESLLRVVGAAGDLRQAVRAHFESHVSFAAVGGKLRAAYEEVLLLKQQQGREPRLSRALT